MKKKMETIERLKQLLLVYRTEDISKLTFEERMEYDNAFAHEIVKLFSIHDVSGSLLSDKEIREAADEWVFDKNGMKWSNNDNTAGDNYGSFMAGAKWALKRLCNDR